MTRKNKTGQGDKNPHTVEKIGGTSISKSDVVLDNILIGDRKGDDLYNRIFVLSAYAGITDKLLEHKKTNEPGVYSMFCGTDSEWAWSDSISAVCEEMRKINARIFTDKNDCAEADRFVRERIEGVRSCMIDLHRLCSYGHFKLDEHLMTVREMLSALGEAHSAYNTTLLLQKHGVNAQFVDLTGWRDMEHMDLDERIESAFEEIDVSTTLPIVTGYAQCNEGLMNTFDRGYTEITFSRLAVLTKAHEAIIHKEYHLSSADPKIVSEDKVMPIGRTNYDVADQLSNLGMEAIHPRAAKGLRQSGILLRVRNTFEREHAGTTIETDYCSETPCVEIIAGRRNVYAIEFFDQDMVGDAGYDEAFTGRLRERGLKPVAKDFNANTITYYVVGPISQINKVSEDMERLYKNGEINIHKVAAVAAIGSDMHRMGLLKEAVSSLTDNDIKVLSIHQMIRLADILFIVSENDYERAICKLHEALVEKTQNGANVHSIAAKNAA